MIDEAVYSRTIGYAGFSSIAGSRLYSVLLPEDPTIPCAAYQKIASVGRVVAHSMASKICDTLFQFSIFAGTPKQAKQLAQAVKDCWHGYSGTIGSEEIILATVEDEIDQYEQDVSEYFVSVDVNIKHREA